MDWFFGAQLKPLSDEAKQQLALRYGLEVTAIKKGKLADAGITKGMILLQVNDQEMRTVEDFENAVKAANQSNDRVLWIRAITQSGRRVATAIDLSEDKKEKCWSFGFSISPSNERPELVSFRMDWLHLLAVQGSLKSLLQSSGNAIAPFWHKHV